MMLGDAEHRAHLKELYGFENWPRHEPGQLRPLPLLATNHMPLPFLKQDVIADGYVNFYGADDFLVYVSIQQYASTADAHEELVSYLADSMSIRLPLGKERGVDIGDISVAGHHELHLALAFVRQEIFVRVHSVGDQEYPILEFAQIVDDILQ